MDVVADLPADAQPSEPVQQANRALHDVTLGAQPGAVRGAAAGDDGLDSALPQQAPVFVLVIAPVGQQEVRPSAGPSHPSAHRLDPVQQRDELGDVVVVAAGQGDGQRNATTVGQDVVLGARPPTVDRTPAGFGPPLSART
ncbi:hypothetical protein GCM10009550_22040 [Actinocorallia libanotica]|uniref:Uncharacterized protein n=1 Tax=Actinocorallia libanotica TaxID=46162 RepID=A0ABN1QSN1_9ACTN